MTCGRCPFRLFGTPCITNDIFFVPPLSHWLGVPSYPPLPFPLISYKSACMLDIPLVVRFCFVTDLYFSIFSHIPYRTPNSMSSRIVHFCCCRVSVAIKNDRVGSVVCLSPVCWMPGDQDAGLSFDLRCRSYQNPSVCQ